MIMDIQKNKAKYGQGDISSQSQGGQQNAIVNLHKELYNHAQDAFTISDDKVLNQGKVTFKS